jgi:hypothetical protein
LYEPAGFWLPKSWIEPGTSLYVQGVEVPPDYTGKIPEGCDLIEMPACQVMIFQVNLTTMRYSEKRSVMSGSDRPL